MNKRKRLLAILINGMLLSSLCVASAADVTAGAGNGVAYGTGSSANNTQDIAVGNKAKVENYVGQNGSVAIGANAWGKHHILVAFGPLLVYRQIHLR